MIFSQQRLISSSAFIWIGSGGNHGLQKQRHCLTSRFFALALPRARAAFIVNEVDSGYQRQITEPFLLSKRALLLKCASNRVSRRLM